MITLTFQDIQKITNLKSLTEYSNKVSLFSQGNIYRFYNQELKDCGYHYMYPYFLEPKFNECDNNYRSRYMVVGIEGDEVLVPIKITTMFKKNCARIYGYPVSLLRNRVNEYRVLTSLLALNNIFDCIMLITFGKTYSFDNYYNTLPDILTFYNSRKYKNTRRLSKIIPYMSVTYNDFKFDEVERVLRCWLSNKDKMGSPLDQKAFILSRTDKDFHLISYYYKNQIVGYSIHILNFNNKICRHILQKTICHTSKELLHAEGYSFSDEDTKILRNGVVAYIEKDFHNFINSSGVKVVYADGTRGNKNMKIYKDKYYKNIIKYSPYTSISLEDYLTLRNSCVIV